MVNQGSEPVISAVLTEREQAHETRKPLFEKLESLLGRPVVSFFTSFRYPVMIEDADADMIEGVLRKLDLSNGLALMISSPGGDALAAERIVNVCRSYSRTGDYLAIVPGKAKSAATMICFGAKEIWMGPSSELGPVDPQVTLPEGDGRPSKRLSVYNVVKSYEKLFEQAVRTDGHLEPFLQQLAHYDARDIAELKAALELSVDLSVSMLARGMMSGRNKEAIKKAISMFLTPEHTKNHGRPIYRDETQKCGLAVKCTEPSDPCCDVAYELYVRTNAFVSTRASKCVESRLHSFMAPGFDGGK